MQLEIVTMFHYKSQISVSVVQASNEETKEHLYETLLAECRDTIQAVKEELKSEAVRYTRLKG